jgi:hypothetical protein
VAGAERQGVDSREARPEHDALGRQAPTAQEHPPIHPPSPPQPAAGRAARVAAPGAARSWPGATRPPQALRARRRSRHSRPRHGPVPHP